MEAEEAIERLGVRGDDPTIFEHLDTLKNINEQYKEAFGSQLVRETVIKVPAEKTQEEVLEFVGEGVMAFLE